MKWRGMSWKEITKSKFKKLSLKMIWNGCSWCSLDTFFLSPFFHFCQFTLLSRNLWLALHKLTAKCQFVAVDVQMSSVICVQIWVSFYSFCEYAKKLFYHFQDHLRDAHLCCVCRVCRKIIILIISEVVVAMAKAIVNRTYTQHKISIRSEILIEV